LQSTALSQYRIRYPGSHVKEANVIHLSEYALCHRSSVKALKFHLLNSYLVNYVAQPGVPGNHFGFDVWHCVPHFRSDYSCKECTQIHYNDVSEKLISKEGVCWPLATQFSTEVSPNLYNSKMVGYVMKYGELC